MSFQRKDGGNIRMTVDARDGPRANNTGKQYRYPCISSWHRTSNTVCESQHKSTIEPSTEMLQQRCRGTDFCLPRAAGPPRLQTSPKRMRPRAALNPKPQQPQGGGSSATP